MECQYPDVIYSSRKLSTTPTFAFPCPPQWDGGEEREGWKKNVELVDCGSLIGQKMKKK